jgi:hypothetical protein
MHYPGMIDRRHYRAAVIGADVRPCHQLGRTS